MFILQKIYLIKTFASKNSIGEKTCEKKEYIIHLYLIEVQTASLKPYQEKPNGTKT